jgi:hypothetical protein
METGEARGLENPAPRRASHRLFSGLLPNRRAIRANASFFHQGIETCPKAEASRTNKKPMDGAQPSREDIHFTGMLTTAHLILTRVFG